MEVSYILRHYLATLKYRCSRSISNVPEHYPTFEAGYGVRKPIEILAHISNVLRWAQSMFNQEIELKVEMNTWNEEVERFYKEINTLDKYVSEGMPDRERITERLLQGPLTDAMTHVGQLAMIRRMAGDPVPGEDYFNADIRIEE